MDVVAGAVDVAVPNGLAVVVVFVPKILVACVCAAPPNANGAAVVVVAP